MSEDTRATKREIELARLLVMALKRAPATPATRATPVRQPTATDGAAEAWEGMAAAFELLADHASFMAERARTITPDR